MRLDLRFPSGLTGGPEQAMRRGVRWLVAALAIAGACAKGGGDEVAPAEGPAATVEVRNNYALPVEIFAQGSGINQRLGTVHPGMRGHFNIPPAMLGGRSVELQAVAGTGQAFRSGPLLLSPGAIVDFTVEAQLFNSTAIVRP
jgi:hypothetical protein